MDEITMVGTKYAMLSHTRTCRWRHTRPSCDACVLHMNMKETVEGGFPSFPPVSWEEPIDRSGGREKANASRCFSLALLCFHRSFPFFFLLLCFALEAFFPFFFLVYRNAGSPFTPTWAPFALNSSVVITSAFLFHMPAVPKTF